jgi:hypothetical protein
MAYSYKSLVINFSFQDDDGANSSMGVHLPADVTNFAEAKAIADIIAPHAAAISDAALKGYTVTLSVYDDSDPSPAAGSDVENKGVFLLSTAGGFRSSLAVPGIKESVLISSGALTGIQIDMSDADVAAFVSDLVDGVTVGVVTYEPSDYRGSDIAGVIDAYKQNRASFKSRGRKG